MRQEDTRYLLHKIALNYGAELISEHPWIFESAKWRELVFSIIAQHDAEHEPIPHSELNDLTLRMEALGLIEPVDLAELEISNAPTTSQSSPLERRIVGILEESGFSGYAAHNKLRNICAMALFLQQSYDGKIQRYLRDAGERMLNDVLDKVDGQSRDKEHLALALTFWMQNVLNLPLLFCDTKVLRFCRENGIDKNELVDAADSLDLSVACLDDIFQLYYADRGEEESGEDAHKKSHLL
jgi:hypothetical protein